MNFVLIHGAWMGGWCWRDVARLLRQAGHDVHTPTFTGLGERAHLLHAGVRLSTFIDDVSGLIECEELDDIVLVGHSFGAMVACAVADRMGQVVRHLILVDGLVARHGQSALAVLPPPLQAQRGHTDDPEELRMPVPDPAQFGVVEPAQVAWVKRHMRPHPLNAYTEPLVLRHPLGNGLPVTYIAATQPWYAPLAPVRDMVKLQPGWRWRELPVCHAPMIDAPALLAQELLAIAAS